MPSVRYWLLLAAVGSFWFGLILGSDTIYILPQEEYSLKSPGYPEPIPANSEKSWQLKSPAGTFIKFVCHDIRMFQNNPPSCDEDVLIVQDYKNKYELCGVNYDFNIISSVDYLQVKLKIGPYMSGGVSCVASVVEKEQTEAPKPIEPVNLKLKPGGPEEVITSPDYPSHCAANVDQTWNFETDQNSKIRITCNDIRLHERENKTCGSDVLTIIDGDNIKELCGNKFNFTMLSSGNKMTVNFKKVKSPGGGFKCLVQGRIIEWYGEATPPPTVAYWKIESEEIDSTEDGGPPGKKGTTCPCGWANKRKNSRIIGGVVTEVNEFPFASALYGDGSGSPHCGASLVTAYHAITAAHCVNPTEKYILSVGNHDYSTDKDTNATEFIKISKVISHEEYQKKRPNYDISLLVLERKVNFNKYVGPVCLPRQQLTLDGQYVKPIGWGMVKPFEFGSPLLKKVNVRVVPHYTCSRVSSSVSSTEKHQICTFSKLKGLGRGDSGGPVVWIDKETNRYTLVGIPSFVYLYKEKNSLPDVSTDVSSFLPWILDKIKETNPEANACWALE